MTRFALAIALALGVAACALDPRPSFPIRDPSGILVAPGSPAVDACPANLTTGVLVVDAESGVAIEDGHHLPIVWPSGFHARTIDGTVEVLDRSGGVAARTGTRVQIDGGQIGDRWITCGGVTPAPS